MGNGKCTCMLISRDTFFFTNFSLAYGEFILDRLIERSTESVEIYVMYDIACTLYKHLKV